MFEIIIAALCIMAVSLTGVLFVNKVAAQFLEKRLSLLVSFSTGVFLVVATLLAVEVFHIVHSPLEGILLIGLGYILAIALQYFIPESHHHHGETCVQRAGAKKIIVGDAIHNVTDGIILVPAFIVSTPLGIAVAVSIVIHEALQEISEFFVLRQAGYSVKKALLVNLAVSSTVLLGVLVGWFSLSTELLEGALLAVSSGFFIHVLLHDLLPHTKQAGAQLTQAIVALLAGAIIMLGIHVTLGESHTHGDDHGEQQEEHEGEEELHL